MDSDCIHKVKRHLLLGKKAVTNLDSILKRRDITLLKKGHIIKAMVCPVSHVQMSELGDKESQELEN